MTETRIQPPMKEASTGLGVTTPVQPLRLSAEDRKIVYRLQDHIDENGKYADALKPIALGYAAGKGVGEYEAKQAIDAKFEQEIGMSLKGYIEDYRQKRGLSVGNER